MTLDVLSGTLTAADPANRALRYRLVRYGEEGATSAGRVRIRAGALTLPGDPGGARRQPRARSHLDTARCSGLEDSADEPSSRTFTVAATRAGDDLLAEAAAGLRTGASVEPRGDPGPRRHRRGRALLVGAGFVVRPAFASSRLLASLVEHPDEGPDPTPAPPVAPDPTPAPAPPAPDPLPEPTPVPDPVTPDPEAPPMTVETLAASAVAPPPSAAALTTGARPAPAPALTAADVSRMLAQTGIGRGMPDSLRAALSDINYTPNALTSPPQWLGEVWSAAPYQRILVPLLAHGELTSLNVTGWRWVQKPAMAPYGGDKTAVPSNPVSTEAVTEQAVRYAGAHDVDRAFVDFGNESFWAGYWAAMAASYASSRRRRRRKARQRRARDDRAGPSRPRLCSRSSASARPARSPTSSFRRICSSRSGRPRPIETCVRFQLPWPQDHGRRAGRRRPLLRVMGRSAGLDGPRRDPERGDALRARRRDADPGRPGGEHPAGRRRRRRFRIRANAHQRRRRPHRLHRRRRRRSVRLEVVPLEQGLLRVSRPASTQGAGAGRRARSKGGPPWQT